MVIPYKTKRVLIKQRIELIDLHLESDNGGTFIGDWGITVKNTLKLI